VAWNGCIILKRPKEYRERGGVDLYAGGGYLTRLVKHCRRHFAQDRGVVIRPVVSGFGYPPTTHTPRDL